MATPAPSPTFISEDDFETNYRPMTAPSGDTVWTYAEIKAHRIGNIWTILDNGDEDGTMYASPGLHHVNRIGYTVTEAPWEDDMIDAIWATFPDNDDDEN